MSMLDWGPWAVLGGYCLLTIAFNPRRVSAWQFFQGGTRRGGQPGIWLVAASAAITWIFAKSIANSSALAAEFGPIGGIGYAIYYLSFAVAAVTIYLLRTHGNYRSLADFLVSKYGWLAARLFLITIAIRLFNEVWSNTKVAAEYFGPEGSAGYWTAVVVVTLFTAWYSWTGGMRSSLLTDGAQMVLAAVLLAIIMTVVFPPLVRHGIAATPAPVYHAGITFCLLAAVQVLSYPFHDPVLTDRGFLNRPGQMVIAFLIAGAISGGFILLFSGVGLYARTFGLAGAPAVSVPGAFGLAMLLVFNGIMLTSAGSTIDSTFTSVAKWTGRDWRLDYDAVPDARDVRRGRIALVAIAVLGNLPLLTFYLQGTGGPAIIAATTLSGTMVMGLAPIFLLAFLRPAGRLSFHLAYWPGLAIGLVRTIEGFSGPGSILPSWVALGSGKYAIDLGANVYGLALCTTGYFAGAAITAARARSRRVAAAHAA